MEIREILDQEMDGIDYGWIDKNGGRHETMRGFPEKYALQTTDELRQSKLGVCWDQVELEREILTARGVKMSAYFIVYYGENMKPTHSFVIYETENSAVWYEHSWGTERGYHEYPDRDSALRAVRQTFIEKMLKNKYDPDYLRIYEYPAPAPGTGCEDFYKFCGAQKIVEID